MVVLVKEEFILIKISVGKSVLHLKSYLENLKIMNEKHEVLYHR